MENQGSHAVKVIGMENGVLKSYGQIAILLIHPNITGHKVSIVAVSGDNTHPWKSFVLNSMLKYLECEGAGNWFTTAWKTRTQNIFHGDPAHPVTSGIYFWPEPFLVENSSGDISAVLLMDVVDNEPGNPFMALATLMSSTLISTSVGHLNLKSLEAFDNVYEPRSSISVKSRLEQFIPIIFDAQSQTGQSFGANSGTSFYSGLDTQNEINLFMKLLNRSQVWCLPHQKLIDNESTIQPGPEFTRHYKKLFRELDADCLPWIYEPSTHSISELLNYLYGSVHNVQELVETGFFKGESMDVTRSDNSESFEPDCTNSTDVDMLDLSESEPESLPARLDCNEIVPPPEVIQDSSPARPVFNESVPPPEVIQHPQPKPGGNSSQSHSQTFHNGNVNSALTCAKFEGNLPEAHASCLNIPNQPTRELSNQEKDNLLQNYMGKFRKDYAIWLKARPFTEMSKSSIQKEHEEYANGFFDKFKEFCEENYLDYTEGVNVCGRIIQLEFNKIFNSRIRRTSTKEEPLNEEQIQKSLDVLLDKLIKKYTEIMEPQCYKIETTPKQLQDLHKNKLNEVLKDVDEFFNLHHINNVDGPKEYLSKILEEKFAELENTRRQVKKEIHGVIEKAVAEYSMQMGIDMNQLIQRSFTLDQFKTLHQNILKRVTDKQPTNPAYMNYFQEEMRKQTQTTKFRFDDLASSIFKYNTEMRKWFDMRICFSAEKLIERSNTVKTRIFDDYQLRHKDIDLELLHTGVTVVEKSAEAHNREIQDNVTKEAEYVLTKIKNFYNTEMKSRLESDIFKSQDLQSMHEKLKNDCYAAFTESLNVHEDSGIPDKKKILYEELDTCFMGFSNSNDSKLEKSTRTISATIRKMKFQFVDTIEEKIQQRTYSPKDFKSLIDDTISEVSKLLEIEIRKIPYEDVNAHREALRKSVETEIPDLQTENKKKWDIQEEARKKQEEEDRKKRDEEKKRKNREEAERKKKANEEKQRKDKEEAERKEAARKLQDEKEEERKKAADQQNVLKMNTSSSSNTSRTQYDTSNSEYGKYSTYAAAATAGRAASPSRNSLGITNQTDNFTIGIEFGPTKIIVGMITVGDEFKIIPNEHGENETLNAFGFNKESKVICGKSAKSSEGSGFYSADTIFSTNTKSKEKKPTQIRLKGNKVLTLRAELECGIMLSHMKRNAELRLNRPVHNVVITVPLWFNSKKRQQMKDSAWIAGFSNVYLINETSAVALSLSKEESRKYTANDMLVVVKNERCDAAVYSYSSSQIKMISNFGNEQLPDGGFFKKAKDVVLSWVSTQDPEQDIIKTAVKVAKQKSPEVDIKEVALVADADEESICVEMRTHGRLRHLRHSNCIITGAARLARTITMGQRNPIKDLCTLGFHCSERRKETLLIEPHCPYPIQQKVSFGERSQVKGNVIEGSVKVGELLVKSASHGFNAFFNLEFVLNSDGILSHVVEKNNSQLEVKWDMDNLKPDEIDNLREIVQSLH